MTTKTTSINVQGYTTASESSSSLLNSLGGRITDAFGYNRQVTHPPRWYNDENFGLTWLQRVIGCVTFFLLGVLLFFMSFFSLPLIFIRPAKFAAMYTFGSLLIIGGIALLKGPRSFLFHLCSGEKIFFSTAYFGCMFFTLYFSIFVKYSTTNHRTLLFPHSFR